MMLLPMLRYSNPMRNQGYMMRLVGQRGGSLFSKRRTVSRPFQNQAYMKRMARRRRRRPQHLVSSLYKTLSTGQSGRGLLGAVHWGLSLGKDKRYKRMGAIGARGHYNRIAAPWEV